MSPAGLSLEEKLALARYFVSSELYGYGMTYFVMRQDLVLARLLRRLMCPRRAVA